MSYEYKNKIKHDLEHLNEYGLISGVYKLQQKLNELDEVYAKAQAFDKILKSKKEAISGSHMADDVMDILNSYESGDPSC